MKNTPFAFCVLLAWLFAACTEEMIDETPFNPFEEGLEEVLMPLRCMPVQVVGEEWSVAPDTRVADSSIKDNLISNIWVFQYNKAGNQITSPHYYTLPANTLNSGTANVMLRPATDCQVYVIANTNSNAWLKGLDVSTLAKLKKLTHTFTSENNVYGGNNKNLMMLGNVAATIKAGQNNTLSGLSLKRMFAMITFKYTFADNDLAKKLKVTRITLNNVPNTLQIEEPTGIYPSSVFTPIDYSVVTTPVANTYYTGYLLENLQGTISNADEKNKNEKAPANAISIKLYIDSEVDGGSYVYTVYPGENNSNDFNIKRNYKYTLNLNLKSSITDSRVMAAPANCFVMRQNASIVFDPYERTETGGGWKYTDYVNETVPAKTLSRVEILWQTGGSGKFAIGNNTSGTRVYLKDGKVYVTSGNTDGNAVIAGYNSNGVVLWSWHIWVNDSSPAQVANAVPYTTYDWDEYGIHANNRVEGRPVMSCNLGALSSTAVGAKSYGLLYQWGRKDPFLQGKEDLHVASYPYSSTYIVAVYDNTGKQITMSSTEGTGELFQTTMVSTATGCIDYVLKNPTHFIKTTDRENSAVITDYTNDGDWFWMHNDRLWGGKPVTEASKIFETNTPHALLLADNGADLKSVFDPCPSGWMLAPGDMWLGFTKDGYNSVSYETINCSETNTTENSANFGYHIYMQGWKKGIAVYFPSQGFRICNGSAWRNGVCGNYHTSTPGRGGTVYILHLHTTSTLLIFEPAYSNTRRSIGGPVRCVREVK